MLDAPPKPAAVKEHQTAINGFIFWVLTWFGLGMFILWSTFDEQTLHYWQFTYYPDKYWALACPAIFCMLFYYGMTTYYLSHLKNTKPLSDALCITDGDARINAKTGLGALTEGSKSTSSSVPAISDIPVGVTSRVLFQPWK
jgi:phosphatidylinositol N-acetylglucosaminyltransferase subunit P